MGYFEDGGTVPPPFNMAPTMKTFNKILACGKSNKPTKSLIVSVLYKQQLLYKNVRQFFNYQQ